MATRATHSLSAYALLGLQPAAEWVLATLTHVPPSLVYRIFRADMHTN